MRNATRLKMKKFGKLLSYPGVKTTWIQ